jgi:hypothetical protein
MPILQRFRQTDRQALLFPAGYLLIVKPSLTRLRHARFMIHAILGIRASPRLRLWTDSQGRMDLVDMMMG